MYELTIIDEFNQSHSLKYIENEHPSLMELLRDRIVTDIGDCRGRVWCNTCAVRLLNVKVNEVEIEEDERALLNSLIVNNIRLSCQLLLDKTLNGTTWEILDSRNLF